MEGMRLKWTQAVCLPRFQPRVPFLAHVVLSPTSPHFQPAHAKRLTPVWPLFLSPVPPSPSFIIITQPILFIRMHLTITSPCLCIHIYFIFLFQYGAYLLRMYGESPTFQFHSLELCYLTSYHSSWRYILLPCVCCIQHVLEIGLYINSVRFVRFKYVVLLYFHTVDHFFCPEQIKLCNNGGDVAKTIWGSRWAVARVANMKAIL